MAIVVASLALSQGAPREASAQQAIITMPAADTTAERQFFVMHETQARFWGSSPYWSGTYFLTYGVGSDTELARTMFDVGVDGQGALYGNAMLAVGSNNGRSSRRCECSFSALVEGPRTRAITERASRARYSFGATLAATK